MRILLATLLLLAPMAARAQTLTMFAAASLTDAMRQIDRAWQAAGHPAVRFNFASSSTLARQMEQGAPANLFASADVQWMDYAEKQGSIVPETRRVLLGNQLVLVMPRTRARSVAIDEKLDLAALLGPDGRLAVGDPSNVPAGIYARQAFTKLGLWAAVQPRLAPAADVRAALLLVGRGEAPAGVVYATDAAAAPDVAIAGVFPESSHDPIVYPFAIARAGDTAEARAFLGFLAGPQAGEAFLKQGFALVR